MKNRPVLFHHAFMTTAMVSILFFVSPMNTMADEKAQTGPGGLGSELSDTVSTGDMVTARVTITLENGTVVHTSDPTVAGDPNIRTIRGYAPPSRVQPDAVIAGGSSPIPGLSGAVLGMRQGEKRLVSLPAEKAYGTRDPSKIRRYDRNRETPRTITMGPKDFVNQFGRLPVTGKEVSINPYFSSKIVEVAEDHVTLEHLAVPGNHTEAIGNTEISVEGDRILLKLTPRVGDPFTIDGSEGSISALDEKTFSVDGNHPAAGHPVRVAIEVVSVTAASTLKAMELPWTEDYQEGLARAGKEGKPAVLVLYLPACDWCHRLFEETFADPLVKPFRDDFVWIKVNCEENPKYKALYDHKNYPTTVILRPDGTVIKKIEGFRDAGELVRELDLWHARTS